MGNRLMVRVLGPVDVLAASGPVAVGGRQVRALLGALAIGAGHAVPIDHLHEFLWAGHPPSAANNTLQSYVSHLRQILGAEAVVRIDHSYELMADHVDVDAVLFERLVNEAAASRAAPDRCKVICAEALGLWRGRPFGDLADDEGFRVEAYRLDELRLVTMELSLEADLISGREELIVGELESAVEEHPYRERLWYLLIAALSGSGRRVEALRACERLRGELAEVGLGPTGQLTALEQDILAGRAPSLTVPTTPGST